MANKHAKLDLSLTDTIDQYEPWQNAPSDYLGEDPNAGVWQYNASPHLELYGEEDQLSEIKPTQYYSSGVQRPIYKDGDGKEIPFVVGGDGEIWNEAYTYQRPFPGLNSPYTGGKNEQQYFSVYKINTEDGFEPEVYPYKGSGQRTHESGWVNWGYVPVKYDTQAELDDLIKEVLDWYSYETYEKWQNNEITDEEFSQAWEKAFKFYSEGYRLYSHDMNYIVDPIMPGPDRLLYNEPAHNTPIHKKWYKYRGDRGIAEVFEDRSEESMGFIGSISPFGHNYDDIETFTRVGSYAYQIETGGELTDEEVLYLADFIYANNWRANETTFWGGTVDMALDVIPWGGEIYVAVQTFGAGSAGVATSAGTKIGAKQLLKKVFGPKVVTYVSKALQSPAFKGQVTKKILGNQTKKEVADKFIKTGLGYGIYENIDISPSFNPETNEYEWGVGSWWNDQMLDQAHVNALKYTIPNLAIVNKEDKSFELAYLSTGMELDDALTVGKWETRLMFFSEMSGGAFLKPMFKGMSLAGKSTLTKYGILEALMKKNPIEKFPGTENQYYNAIATVMKAGGWDGLFEEWGEEWVERGARGLAHYMSENGFADPALKEAGWEWEWPTAEEALQELAVLALAGSPKGTAGSIAKANEYYTSKVFKESPAGKVILDRKEKVDAE